MTTVALPYLNKLSGTYSKKVTFKNFVCAAHNNYIRKMANGLACVATEYSLKYIGLTDAELAAIETLFSTHDLDSFIEFQSPIDVVSAPYRKPLGWKKDSYTEILGTTGAVVKERRHTISFSLVKNLSTDEILAIQEVLGELQLVDDFALLPSGYTEAYVQCFDNDTLPYVASGANYNALLYKNGSEAKTITVVGEGVWSISNYGTATFTKDNAFNGTPTPIQYVVYDKWNRKSNYAWISLKNLTQTTSWGRGGWYGGTEGTNIWIADLTLNQTYGDSVRGYRADPNVGTFTQIPEFNLGSSGYLRGQTIEKTSSKWFLSNSSSNPNLKIYDNALNLLTTYNYYGVYNIKANETNCFILDHHYYSGYLNKYPIPPTPGTMGSWVYHPSLVGNASSLEYEYEIDITNTKIIAIHSDFNKVVMLDITPVSTTTVSIVGYGNVQFNMPVFSVDLAVSLNSQVTDSTDYIFVSLPLLGQVAKINKVNSAITYINVAGLTYTDEGYFSKPSYLIWLPELQRVAVSCLGDNTLKLFTEDGTLTHTLSTGLKPGRAFIVDNVLYIPCMEQSVTNRFLF